MKKVTKKAQEEKLERLLQFKVELPARNYKGQKIVRSYRTLQGAIIGSIRWLLDYGKVMQLCEIYHAESGLQFGVIKLDSQGKLKSDFNIREFVDEKDMK